MKPVRIVVILSPQEAWQVTAAACRAETTRALFIKRALLDTAANTPSRADRDRG